MKADLMDPSRFGLPSRTVLVDNGGGFSSSKKKDFT